ncbi:MAG: peptidoglycan DD-metalloendopeptidase family protein [Rickettsiales bacterium]|nr:peptidoglycan DD-metalloendopeptidase family protein [Rickettsiales bacterium]
MTASLAHPRSARRGYAYKQSNRTPGNAKRVNGVRFSWFVIGSLFGLGMSFLMNLFVSNVVFPKYQDLITEQQDTKQVADLDPLTFTEEDQKPLDETVAVPAEPAKPAFPRDVTMRVEKGDTLLNMLVREEVDYDEAVDVIGALKKTYDPRQMRIGQKIAVTLNAHAEATGKATVDTLSIRLSKLESVQLERLPGGAFFVENQVKEQKPHLTYAGGIIDSSLFQTGYENDVPNGVLAQLMNAYSYDVDLQREIRQGDKMEVLFERMMTEDGDEAGYGKVYYAMLKLRNDEKKIYRFEDKKGHVGFYDINGESVIKALLKTPVNGARISSGYGKRRHPILGYTKMHKGVDFAAPTGTPIYAAGDGVVKYRGRKGGYGNYVSIRHNSKYTTAYAHMKGFARGIKNGARVKQGQVIGYVGSTGRSTGPHLHYEVHKYGSQVNPRKERFKTGRILKGTELANFKKEVNRINGRVAALSKETTKVARNEQQ